VTNVVPNAGTKPGNLPIRMLHDRLLVEPETDSAERQSTAGLVIPATTVAHASRLGDGGGQG
jgi:chaperonin GroES